MARALEAFGQPTAPLGFTRADDALLALGCAHLRRLVDGHQAATAAQIPKHHRFVWPREVDRRRARPPLAARETELARMAPRSLE